MSSREFPESSKLRAIVAIYFIFSGALLLILTVLGGLVFFPLCCSLLWLVSGFVWLSRPSVAARICAFPVLATSAGFRWALLPSLREHVRRPVTWVDVLAALCVVVALTLVVIAIWKTARTFAPLAITLVFMVAAFFADRGLINETAVHTFPMKWTVDDSAPWGHVDFDKTKGPPIVLYREYDGGYCFDVLYSDELRRKLIEINKPSVRVIYSSYKDFGRERGYNLVSVEGLIFTQGGREVRPGYTYGGSTQRVD
jgi:hypothetical protein